MYKSLEEPYRLSKPSARAFKILFLWESLLQNYSRLFGIDGYEYRVNVSYKRCGQITVREVVGPEYFSIPQFAVTLCESRVLV